MLTKAPVLTLVPPLKIGVRATRARKTTRNAANTKAGVSVVVQRSTCLLNAPKGNLGKEKGEDDGIVVNPPLPLGKTPLLLTQKVNVGAAEPQMLERRLRGEPRKCTSTRTGMGQAHPLRPPRRGIQGVPHLKENEGARGLSRLSPWENMPQTDSPRVCVGSVTHRLNGCVTV